MDTRYYWWIAIAIVIIITVFAVSIIIVINRFSIETPSALIKVGYLWIIVGLLNLGVWLFRVFSRQELVDLGHLAVGIFLTLMGIILVISKV